MPGPGNMAEEEEVAEVEEKPEVTEVVEAGWLTFMACTRPPWLKLESLPLKHCRDGFRVASGCGCPERGAKAKTSAAEPMGSGQSCCKFFTLCKGRNGWVFTRKLVLWVSVPNLWFWPRCPLEEPEAMPMPSADDLALAPLVGANLSKIWCNFFNSILCTCFRSQNPFVSDSVLCCFFKKDREDERVLVRC